MIDTHCHLHRAEFDADRNAVLARAREAGLTALIDPATDFASNQLTVELARRHPDVYAAVGIHPHDAVELTDEILRELASLGAQEKVAAVGEIGLDYFRDLSPRPVQQEALRKLLRLAHELGKPVILHCRDAFPDLFAILR